MGYKSKSLATSSLTKRILRICTILIIFLICVSIVSAPGIDYEPMIDIITPGETNAITNENYANISLYVNDTNYNSSFINWNNSLVGYWNFDNIYDSYIKDDSTYGNNATFVGRNGTNNMTFGKYGIGFYFNGSGEGYLDSGNNASLNVTSNNITVELWFKEFETSFNKTIGWGENDTACYINKTTDGGYIMVGSTNCSNKTDPTKGNLSLIKVDANGDTEWIQTYDQNLSTEFDNGTGRCVQQTTDGGYIIVGNMWNGTNQDLWLIKTYSDGTIDWNSHSYGNYTNDMGYSVKQNGTEGYIITGEIGNWSSSDLWLLKVKNNGEYDWNKTFNGADKLDDVGYSVVITDSGYMVTGYTTESAHGNELLIITTDFSGRLVNTGIYDGGTGDDWGKEIQPTNDGYIVIGTTRSGAANLFDAWLVKVSNSGTIGSRAAYDFGEKIGGGDYGNSGVQTSDSGFILTGCYDKRVPNDIILRSGLMLIKTNQNLQETWNRTFWGNYTGLAEGNSVRETSDRGYIVAAEYNFTNQPKDILIAKTDSSGNITESNNDQGLNKTLVGKGRDTYQIELYNGTISGYINGVARVSTSQSLYNLSQYWHQVALTYDGSLVKLYVNGTLQDSASYTGTINITTNNLTIGNNFSGILDEVRIWNRALNNDEINTSRECSGYYYRNFTDLPDYNYSYYVYAINQTGGKTQSGTRTITIDNTTGPTITPISPIGSTTNTEPEISASISDPAGVDISSITINVSGADRTSQATNTTSGDIVNICYTPSLSVGTYWVNITALDNFSHFSYRNWTFSIVTDNGGTPSPPLNAAPKADAGGTYSGYVNASITFTGSGNDTDGKIAGYRWDWTNDGTYDTAWSTSNTATHSYSSAGTYTVKLQVKDNDNATGTDTATVTISPEPSTDNPPLISNVHHSPTKVTINDNITISATVTDDYDITAITLHWNDGSDHSDSMDNAGDNIYTKIIGPFSAGIIEYWIEATDSKQSAYSNHYNFSVAAVADMGNVSSNQTSNTSSEDLSKIGINELSLTPETNQQNVEATVEVLTGLPEEMPDLVSTIYKGGGVVYRYYNITITANNTEIKDSDIKSGKINFEINKNWFKENNVSNSSISLYRYNNNWENLTTVQLETENETYEFYEAETPGFSTFAVVGSKVVEKGETLEKPSESIPWLFIIGFIIAGIAALIFVLFKAKLIYVEIEEVDVPKKE